MTDKPERIFWVSVTCGDCGAEVYGDSLIDFIDPDGGLSASSLSNSALQKHRCLPRAQAEAEAYRVYQEEIARARGER